PGRTTARNAARRRARKPPVTRAVRPVRSNGRSSLGAKEPSSDARVDGRARSFELEQSPRLLDRRHAPTERPHELRRVPDQLGVRRREYAPAEVDAVLEPHPDRARAAQDAE